MASLSLSLFFVFGFLLGALAILGLEILGLLYFLRRQKTRRDKSPIEEDHQSLDFRINKQGAIWVLESDKIAKNRVGDSPSTEQKESVEVVPVRKLAKLRESLLVLTGPDASHATIPLKGCTVQAVSATSLPSRKWAKRFPIKVESKGLPIYKGNRTIYIYAETALEKESWCQALRLACCEDEKQLHWVAKLNEDFHGYLAALNTGHPWFMKPSTGFNVGPFLDRANRLDGPSSKVRLFLKKLTKKASHKAVSENKPSLAREDRKTNEKFCSPQDPALASNSGKTAPIVKPLNCTAEENIVSSSNSASQSHHSIASDTEDNEEKHIDEGTLCWNLLFSRLFFDVKNSTQMKSTIQARIQRTLANMRKPSYIGEIICTEIDLGSLPPYIHGMRVLPADMNEVWALEADIEYSGGVVLDIETRLEVRELGMQKGITDRSSESNPVGDVPSDLLEGIEYFGKQLNIRQGDTDSKEQKNECDFRPDGLKSCKSSIPASGSTSRWKSILNSIAKQVSQVPLSLSIRVASLRGTLRLHIKPPPTDQLWFGFSSMPDIEFDLQSSVGDHKITSGHIASFLINRFKASIRENMVLPNCENISIPWMLAEKDDWIPHKAAPFVWLNQETVDVSETSSSSQPWEVKKKMEPASNEHEHQETESFTAVVDPPIVESSESSSSDLRMPLLSSEEHQAKSQNDREANHECQSTSRSLVQLDKLNSAVEDDESRPKRVGRKARMLDLGKKMGEKLEEKRRHFEERSRSIVEKMKGP